MGRSIFLVLGTMALVASSAAAWETEEIHKEIRWEGEKLVEVEISFGAGDLTLSAGSGDLLLDADVVIPEGQPRPEIRYRVEDHVGKLRLKTEKKKHDWPRRSRWDLRFGDEVPLTFEINLGASESTLDFSGLRVRGLEINTGASSTKILFDRPNPEVLEKLEINVGAAKLRAKGLGNANFKRLRFEGGVGTYTLDFRGRLRHKASVDISMGLAQLTMLIPEDVGAKIEKEAPLTTFSADGFEKEDGYYVNEAFGGHTSSVGSTKGTLIITVEGGLGSINVETVEDF